MDSLPPFLEQSLPSCPGDSCLPCSLRVAVRSLPWFLPSALGGWLQSSHPSSCSGGLWLAAQAGASLCPHPLPIHITSHTIPVLSLPHSDSVTKTHLCSACWKGKPVYTWDAGILPLSYTPACDCLQTTASRTCHLPTHINLAPSSLSCLAWLQDSQEQLLLPLIPSCLLQPTLSKTGQAGHFQNRRSLASH